MNRYIDVRECVCINDYELKSFNFSRLFKKGSRYTYGAHINHLTNGRYYLFNDGQIQKIVEIPILDFNMHFKDIIEIRDEKIDQLL